MYLAPFFRSTCTERSGSIDGAIMNRISCWRIKGPLAVSGSFSLHLDQLPDLKFSGSRMGGSDESKPVLSNNGDREGLKPKASHATQRRTSSF